ncbi:hypothetical protein Poli38472_014328 [Pythium oligandrum]|uniref:Uncharacterized protein n=1 Tax=Pythium oligandrum TaxID=41045 RepID=A0A8K1C7I0_PYTOL|nr:hypothetical protein Poli38472_014328 [Pythium oligandrum]|eukprot:TMW57725.1 hypothetical protein Poli38472_014328 [Pythium oligandrum]
MASPVRSLEPLVWAFSSGSDSPLKVLLDCTGMTISRELVDVLSEFRLRLRPASSASTRLRGLRVGFRFVKCRLKVNTLTLLKDVFAPMESSTRPRLVNEVVELLDLSDNGLLPSAMSFVSSIVSTTVFRQLVLENVLAQALSDGSVEGLRDILRAVLTANDYSAMNEPVKISLAQNSLDSRYFAAIANAVAGGTRELSFLSIERTMSYTNAGDRERSWEMLGYICFGEQSIDSATSSQLMLGSNPFYPLDGVAFQRGVASVFENYLPRVEDALRQGQTVACRVQSRKLVLDPGQVEFAHDILRPDTEYQVLEVRDDGWWQIRAEISGWIKNESIKMLRFGEDRAVKMRFSSINLDRIGDPASFGSTIPLFLQTAGHDIKSLSLRAMSASRLQLSDVFPVCPNLIQLDVAVSHLFHMDTLWEALHNGNAPSLRSLIVDSNYLGYRGLETLARLYSDEHQLPLRHLSLLNTHMGEIGLTHLSQVLVNSNLLEILDMSAPTDDMPATYTEHTRQFHQDHHDKIMGSKPYSLSSKLAFLSAIPHLQSQWNIQSIDTHVYSIIFDFAGSLVRRQVHWHK